MASVAVTLLGSFGLRVDGTVRDLPGQKDRALFAVLGVAPGVARTRDELAGLLWNDRSDAHARDNLKHAVARLQAVLRSADDAAPLSSDRLSIRINPAAIEVDALEFESLLADGTPDSIEAATALYRGDLLEGINVRVPAFEDWLLVERQRFRGRVETALETLIRLRLAEGSRDGALAAAERLIQLDPLREAGWRTQMRIHADRGDRAKALQLYEVLRVRLHRELGVRPGAETASLAEAIRSEDKAPVVAAAPEPAPLSLPDRPSIAVLPFANLGGDPGQDYFADGVVEEIITALSRMRWLFVIARNSSFTYKGRAVDVKLVGRELGVRYILEGTVRAAEGRVRITGHLIDTATGAHLWAGNVDGRLEDIFELQDRVTASVVGAIAPELERAEIDRARRKPTASLDAYDYFLRGTAEVHKWKREANAEALRLLQRSTDLDPEFAAAWGMAARCYSQRRANGWVVDSVAEAAEARRLARRAAELGGEDAVALSTAGIALAFAAGDLDDGAALLDRALVLNPNLAMTWLFLGWTSVWSGDPDVALPRLAHAMRLSPHDPQIAMMQAGTAVAHFFAGRDAEAIAWARLATRAEPGFRVGICVLAASLASRDDLDEASTMVDRLRSLDPQLRLSNFHQSFPIRRPEHLQRWAAGLRRAGLPE